MQHRNSPAGRRPTARTRALVIAAVAAAGLTLSACAEAPEETSAHPEEPKIEQIQGSDLARITLTAKAAERLGIKTAPVSQATVPVTPAGQGSPVQRRIIPYGAVFYDRAGETWAYTNPQPLVFVRHKITVDYVDGQRAILSEGPAVGTPVVTVGATELFGAEFGVDH
jgi:hypothetical protein